MFYPLVIGHRASSFDLRSQGARLGMLHTGNVWTGQRNKYPHGK